MNIETSQLRAVGLNSLAQAQIIGRGIVSGISRALPEGRTNRLPGAVRDPRILGAGAVVVGASVAAAKRKHSQPAEKQAPSTEPSAAAARAPEPVPFAALGIRIAGEGQTAITALIEDRSRVPGLEIGGPTELD